MEHKNFQILVGGMLVILTLGLVFGLGWQNRQTLTAIKPEVISTPSANYLSSAQALPKVLGESDLASSIEVLGEEGKYYVNPFGGGQPVLWSNYNGGDGAKIFANLNSSEIASKGKLYVRGFVYPMPELGYCQNQSDCYTFCELQDNLPACVALAVANGYMKRSALVLGASDNSARVKTNQNRVDDYNGYVNGVNDPTQYYNEDLKKLLANGGSASLSSGSLIPRVLSVNSEIPEVPGGGTGGGGTTSLPSGGTGLESCSSTQTVRNPDTGEIEVIEQTPEERQRCVSDVALYEQNVDRSAKQTQLNTRSRANENLISLSSCFANSRDFASDLQYCLGLINQ